MITNRNAIAPGTKLVGRHKGQEFSAEITEMMGIRLSTGETFKTLSAAGAFIFGPGRTCNGWAFWTVEGTTAPEAKPERLANRQISKPTLRDMQIECARVMWSELTTSKR